MNSRLVRIVSAMAVVFTLGGCLASDEEGDREIRIDLFSHYWESMKLRGQSLGPNKIAFTVDSVSEDNFIVDTLLLLDASIIQSGSLPNHITGRLGSASDSSRSRLFYTTEGEPQDFSCFLESTGKEPRNTEDPDSDEAFLGIISVLNLEGEALTDNVRWFYLESTSRIVTRIWDCGYAPGKGFFLGPKGYDWYAEHPDYAGSEFVIRY